MKHCKNCNKLLTHPTQLKFCSPSCAMSYAHRHGKAGTGLRFKPQGGRVSTNCQNCGKQFELWRYQLKSGLYKYCSKRCRIAAWHKKSTVHLICAWCKKPFDRSGTKVRYNTRRAERVKTSLPYCSPACQSRGLAHLYSPEERAGYVDGRSKLRRYQQPDDWNHIRLQVLKRDHRICRLCGSHRNPTVHHIDHDIFNNDPKNLITLCNSCNVKERWHQEVYEPIIRALMKELSST